MPPVAWGRNWSDSDADTLSLRPIKAGKIMSLFSKADLEAAAGLVHAHMPPTPQFVWPLISEAVGAQVWIKHENHTPTGAFKVRGGITFMDWLRRAHPEFDGIITATRGNHGQSQARAAVAAGLRAKVLVPRGNSVEKNAAMRGFGADLVEFGDDFDEARLEAMRLAEVEHLYPVPPFHTEMVRGVATYAYELFLSAPDLDCVYVPIGCGSGICGVISARDALGLSTRVVGVVSTLAQTAKLSFEAGRLIETNSARTFADGMAVRVPVREAFDIYSSGTDRIVAVSDDEIAAAMRLLYSAVHQVAEGAGAAALAAALQERDTVRGRRVAVILSGGNIDTDQFAQVLQGATPKVA
jgi:threonine dehydratase